MTSMALDPCGIQDLPSHEQPAAVPFFFIGEKVPARASADTSHNGPSKPWDSWPRELPRRGQSPGDLKEYKFIQDPEFLAQMAKEVRNKVLEAARSRFPQIQASVIVLKGGTTEDWDLYDSDTPKDAFRQEAFFRYMFPVNEPDCYAALDLQTGDSLLFVPEISPEMARWDGTRRSFEWYTTRYAMQECHLVQDICKVLQAKGFQHLYIMMGENSDSGLRFKTPADFCGIENFTVNDQLLYPLLQECRAIKTEKEIQLMRIGVLISSQAHVYVMRHVRAGLMELHLETMFKAWTGYYGGARHMSYTCICAAGENGSILHYGHSGRPNDRMLEDGDMMVLDMGAEYSGYGSDLTCSYPVNGRFTPDQAAIFNAVKAAQETVMATMKPGVSWPEMHRLSERIILEHLLNIGVLHKGTVDELMAVYLGSVFMPHGLGHLLGMNVHDCGGYPEGIERPKEPGPCWLRTGRTLEKGMVITVEPGIYFNGPWIDIALQKPEQAQYINSEVLDRFRDFGGVRLERDVLVTEDGIEDLSVLPSTIEEIEAIMQEPIKS